ncbi:MAG: acetyltransferase [Fluviicola sp.]|nr:acetyltransferase [Fluviicola sp.]
MINIVVFGAGLHANVCIDIIEKESKYKIVGIIDSRAEVNSIVHNYPIIGRQENLSKLQIEYKFNAGIIAIGDNYSRSIVKNSILNMDAKFKFINAIHPNAIIGKNVNLGVGIVIMAGVIINPESKIEDFCILNTGAQLEHNCFMGQFSHLSAGSITGGKVSIGQFSAITLGVIILDRITIGENTVVGSGSIVLNNLPDNVLAYGQPAKVIRSRKLNDRFLKSN